MDSKEEVQTKNLPCVEIESKNEEAKAPPPLPPRKEPTISSVSITPDDDVSTISAIRQYYVYNSPYMKDSSEIFGSALIEDSYKSMWQKIRDQFDTSDYWYSFLDDSNDEYILKKQIGSLEENINSGIPDDLRGLVYQKLLRIKKVSKKAYDNLLKKAIDQSTKSPEKYPNIQNYPSNLQNSYKIIQYYKNEIASTNSTRLDIINNGIMNHCLENDLMSDKFIMSIANCISIIPNLNEEDILLVLLKIEKVYVSLLKPEFFYKINRSLEDLHSESFVHITKQGISLNEFYRTCLNSFFSNSIKDTESLIKILDYTLFEGFDFIGRFIMSVIGSHSDTILEKKNDDLLNFLYSDELFIDFSAISATKLQPFLIKYENEYHLIHANSFLNNNNELSNLKEIKIDLHSKINELEHQLEDLNVTHREILEQNAQYETKTNQLFEEREELTSLNDDLKRKFEELTMEQNLKNTIKANREFSQRSVELEAQITELKKNVDKKKNELSKYGV